MDNMDPNKKRKVYCRDDGNLTNYAKKKVKQIIKAEKIERQNEEHLRAEQHPTIDYVENCGQTEENLTVTCSAIQELSDDCQNSDVFNDEVFQLLPEGSENESCITEQISKNLEDADFDNNAPIDDNLPDDVNEYSKNLEDADFDNNAPFDDNLPDDVNEYYSKNLEDADFVNNAPFDDDLPDDVNEYYSKNLEDADFVNNAPCDDNLPDDVNEKTENFPLSLDGLLMNENPENVPEASDGFSSEDSDDEVFQSLIGNNKVPTCVQDLKKDETFLQCIAASVDKSPGEILLMALQFSLENQLPFTATTNLLKMINNIFDSKILPETRYRIDKLCNPRNNLTLHGVCPVCSEYLGILQDVQKITECKMCKTNVNIVNPSDPSFFAIIDPVDAIKDYLQRHEDFYEYVTKERVHDKNIVKDIFDGTAYRKLKNILSSSESKYYVTMTLNTDGAAAFKSSNYSVWPVYLMPNEIPVQDRFKSIIVLGLWFGSSKPDMTIFLEKIVEVLNDLSFNGINCIIKGKDCCIKVFTVQASVDTVARAPMNGTVQFNGHYGCDWCEHPGEYYSGSMRYPFLVEPAPERTHASTIRYAEEALNTGHPVMGVKVASPLLNLKHFDIITSFTPDYMHCILAGVASQYTEYFLNEMTQDQIATLNKLLLEFKVPKQIARLSRSLKDRAYWKAREWENWVLYYSLPLLINFFNFNKRIQHWSLLVKSLYICLQDKISYEQLNELNEMLHTFVSESEELYSLKCMTYNVHQLLHIPKSIQLWGPVFAHSTYPFESANHNLLTAIQSAKGVILQIVRYLNLQRSVYILQQIVYPECSDAVLNFCERDHLKVKSIFKKGSTTYFGKQQIIDSVSLNKYNLSRRTKVFLKMVKGGCLFSSSLKINKRSCNYFALLKNGKFIKIVKFLVDVENNTDLTVCKKIETIPNLYVNYLKEISHESDEEICVPTAEVLKPTVCIRVGENRYVIAVPNLLFY